MKTKLLFFAMFLIGLMSFSQNTYVPDDNFEQVLIDLGYDSGSLDDYVPTANINTITYLEMQFLGITDLTGIEDFSALQILRCNFNQLTTLDVSQNTALTWLDCLNNQLTSIDISQNTALTTLDCSSNKIATLNVSQNTFLTSLNCQDNLLTSLDVSKNTVLTNLSCSYNQLTNIDISKNTALNFLDCDNNQLTSLDLNQNIVLKNLNCYNNQLTSLDVSQNTEIIFLYCYNNQLTSLDVSQNNVLSQLSCSDNQLSSLDLSQNTVLAVLICEFNNLNRLDVKNGNNTIINTFRATDNPNLVCIEVDNATYSSANWTNIDTQTSFSEDCGYLATEDFELTGFSMYPNPIYDVINISINEEATYSIFNINGRILKEGKLSNGDNEINISHLSDGLYLLNIRTDRGFINKKLMKM
ncbi:MAG: leucine-rich repeat domain-containing protein [Bacteroidetes bacterium]|nr:leucine-rich repeat domain-containing protein [Bacteroidota bacterium]